MAALTITTANVQPAANATTISGTAGDTVTIGAVVYQASDGDYELADHATSAPSAVAGICLTNAVAGQPITILTKGELDFGAILTKAQAYMLGNSGQIIPITDLITGDYVSYIGVAKDTETMIINPINSGVQRG